MDGLVSPRIYPELKQMVAEASRALALLDAERLEELARACCALNRPRLDHLEVSRQAREAASGLAVFARVLDATRANLTVMNRLRALHHYGMFYDPSAVQSWPWADTETSDGND
jgi:hypothetical protein